MATKAYFRTIQHAPFTREQLDTKVVSHISHRTWIQDLIQNQGLEYLESPLDVVPLHRRWERNFGVDYSSMVKKNPSRGVPGTKGIHVFTDGSKDDQGTGAGVVILKDGKILLDSEGNEMKYNYHLDKKTTVFQSEVFAQKMAANLIINGSFGARSWCRDRRVTIHSDNQASILALDNVWIKSKLVKETIDLLDTAAGHCKNLSFRLVKSHSKYLGNKMADEAARTGRDDDVIPDCKPEIWKRRLI